jgi:hypothetical protein
MYLRIVMQTLIKIHNSRPATCMDVRPSVAVWSTRGFEAIHCELCHSMSRLLVSLLVVAALVSAAHFDESGSLRF